MSFTLDLTITVRAGGEELSGTITQTAGQLVEYDETISADAADALVAATLDVSQIKALWMMADGDITLETNDGDAPDDTIAMKADEPIEWSADADHACPFTSDVTAFYFTEENSADVVFKAKILVDPTV